MSTQYELANITWPILMDAVAKKNLLFYQQIANQLGYKGARVVRFALGPIQDLCIEKGYPPLTSIVINKQTKRPGSGFIAWHGDLDQARKDVFDFRWAAVAEPFPMSFLNRVDVKKAIGEQPPQNPKEYQVDDQEVRVNGRGPYQEKFRRILFYSYHGRLRSLRY